MGQAHVFTDDDRRRAAQAVKDKAAARKANPALVVTEALPGLFGDLLRAARGEAPFETLPPDKRLAALFKAIEYGAGKPVASDKQRPPSDEADPENAKEAAGNISIR